MTVSLKIPRYVLKHGLHAIGPTIQDVDNGEPMSVIYGFSDKPEYDHFRSQDSRLLKPYPLVARFLMDELRNGFGAKRLIVMDALSPTQETVFATGMSEILDAFNEKRDQVNSSHELIFDITSEIYRHKRVLDEETLSTLR